MINHLPPTDRWPISLLRARWWLDDAPGNARKSAVRVARGFYTFLDSRLFPALETYATHRLHITFMACLWFALIVCGGWTTFELTGGNYTNGLSGLLTCILLLQQQRHHRENTALHAKHAEEVAKLHAKVDTLASATQKPTTDDLVAALTPTIPTTTAPTPIAKPRKRRKADWYNGEPHAETPAP